MICPYCNAEMEEGFVYSNATKIGWSKTKRKDWWLFQNDTGDIILGVWEAYRHAGCCKSCGKIIIEFDQDEVVK